MNRTAWLSLEAEIEVLADELEHRAADYRIQSTTSLFSHNQGYWQGRAEQAEIVAAEIRKAVDERQPEPDDENLQAFIALPRGIGSMHRHPGAWVDHLQADHNHGPCSEHDHAAGGFHTAGTALEIADWPL